MWPFLSTSRKGLHDTPEFPLQLLQEAIDTRDESKVWTVLRKDRIRKELVQSTTTHKVPSDPHQLKYNVFTCVQAAVLQNLPQVVRAMYQLNPADVQLATWYALYRLKKSKQQLKVSCELVELARAQRRSWLWDQIGAFLLLRQGHISTYGVDSPQEQTVFMHPVVTIPDEAFIIILRFVDLHENQEARVLRFLIEARPCSICSRLCIPDHCKAKRLRKMERRASKRRSARTST